MQSASSTASTPGRQRPASETSRRAPGSPPRASPRSTPRERSHSRGSAGRRRSRRRARTVRRCATSRRQVTRRASSIPTDVRSIRRRCRGPRLSARTPRSSTSSATTSGCRGSDSPLVPDAKGALLQTPAPFEYERATSVEGAIASLQRLGSNARVIAGGHSLLPMMKLRLANPEHLIDINDLTDLAYIGEDEDEIVIGALTRHVDLLKSELLADRCPLFRDAEQVIADPVVRNRGTI